MTTAMWEWRERYRGLLTAKGEQTVVVAARIHIDNVERHFLDAVPEAHRDQLVGDLRTLSHTARDSMPRLP